MKKILTTLFTLFLFQTIMFAQTFQWAKQIGGNDIEVGNSIVTDAAGNIYIGGYFRDTVDFDPGAGVFNLYNSSSVYLDGFITKLDASGNFLWAKKFGGSQDDWVKSIAVDAAGNVFATGVFRTTVDFNPDTASYPITSHGSFDIFILKLNTNGVFKWAKSIGGNSTDIANSLTLDALSNVISTGSFRGLAIDFNPGVGTFNMDSWGGVAPDTYISKLDSNGNFVWARQVGGSGTDEGTCITTDALNYVYLAGYYYINGDFDPGPPNHFIQAPWFSADSADIYYLKLTPSGNFVWAHAMGSSGNDNVYSIRVNNQFKVYIGGVFRGPSEVWFDVGSGFPILNTIENLDGFIVKLDSSGAYLSGKILGGSGNDKVEDIDFDASGNLYATGYFSTTVDFNTNPSISDSIISAGQADIFVSRYDAADNYLGTMRMGGDQFDVAYASAIDASGNIFTTGYFSDTSDFDPGNGVFNLVSAGAGDIFITKLVNCSTCLIPTNITSNNIQSTKATINWSGNSCAVKYRIQIRVQGTTNWTSLLITAPNVTKIITPLASNTTYEYRIRTECNVSGTITSGYSTIQSFTTTCSCSKPNNINITNLTQTTAKVNWGGNNCALTYRMQIRIQGTIAWSSIIITAPTTFKLLNGLTNNTTYEFRLRSDCNLSGTDNSGWTTTTTFTTPLKFEETEIKTSIFYVSPNPCTTCEITGAVTATDLMVTDILGRNQHATFSKSANGYYIILPEASTGVFLIRNIKTGEVVKFVRE